MKRMNLLTADTMKGRYPIPNVIKPHLNLDAKRAHLLVMFQNNQANLIRQSILTDENG